MTKHDKKSAQTIFGLLAAGAALMLLIYRKNKYRIENEKNEPELTSENGYFVM